MKTYLPKVNEIERKWYIVDAENLVLGRMAVQIANILRGKHKPTFTPHLDCGDYVVVINAQKVVMTGHKDTDKEYQDYSGHIDGLKRTTADVVRAKNPERLVKDAVWGMMPKGKLGRAQFAKLKVFGGEAPDHGFVAQGAEKLVLKMD